MSSDKNCCVPGCKESGGMHRVLHGFPNLERDKERFNTWLYAIGGDILNLENERIFKYRRVCRSHFEDKYLCRNNKISNIAVPTLNMSAPLSLRRLTSVTRKPLQQILELPSTSSNPTFEYLPHTTMNIGKDVQNESIVPTSNFEHLPHTSMNIGKDIVQKENIEQEDLDDVVYVYDDPQPGASARGDDEPVAGPFTSSAAPASPPVPAPASPPPDVSAENVEAPHPNDAIELDPEILQLLDTDLANQKNYGDMLHKDIASRWAYILANGLSKDTQVELVKFYLPPENCPTMRAPKLNLEIKAALLDINIKKDFFSQTKQNQLGCGLAAIGRVLNWALTPGSLVPQDIIKSLSDAGRLICDSHYKESQSRRYEALSTLNKNIKDTIKNGNIDEQLFGSDLSENIMSSKGITKTGSEITQRPMYGTSRAAINSRGAPPRIAPADEPRSSPAPRRPPRDRRLEGTRGRRHANSARYQARKPY